MRCPKCGTIGFDYWENCAKCGRDLREIRSELGQFAQPDPNLRWFNVPEYFHGLKPPPSGHAADAGEGAGVADIDSDVLEKAAEDGMFQEALDQVVENFEDE